MKSSATKLLVFSLLTLLIMFMGGCEGHREKSDQFAINEAVNFLGSNADAHSVKKEIGEVFTIVSAQDLESLSKEAGWFSIFESKFFSSKDSISDEHELKIHVFIVRDYVYAFSIDIRKDFSGVEVFRN